MQSTAYPRFVLFVEGAYWFGPVPVRLSVSPSAVILRQLRNSRTAYARILKLYMWHVHEKYADRIFFLPRSCRFRVMPSFRLCMNNLENRISEERLGLGS